MLVGGRRAEPTKLKVEFVFDPNAVIAAMHTTTISASITAYSTAVGPSSFFRKFYSISAAFRNDFFMIHLVNV